MNLIKKILYWLTIIMPIIDAGKTIVQAVSDGIEKGKEDVRREQEKANCQYFERCSDDIAQGVTAQFGGYYKKDDQK